MQSNEKGDGDVVKLPLAIDLRDWLAGQAMAGMFASDVSRDWTIQEGGEPHRAMLAYKMADAMLAARGEQ